MNYQNVKNSRLRLKERMVYVMGNKCHICGYNKCITALEFHHIQPTQKVFSFNQAKNYAWEVVKEELKKCILVCANCHREIHQKMIKENLISSFNQERAQEITNIISQHKTKTQYFCKNCGIEITTNTNYCVDCGILARRKINNRPSREELKELIYTKSFCEIGRMFNVSDNAIRKWCDSYKLPRKRSEIKNFTKNEWLEI